MAAQSFQPAVYLGASVNMLNSSRGVFSVSDLFDHPEGIITAPDSRAVSPSQQTSTRTLRAPFAALNDIPNNINVNADEASSTSALYVFESGSKVSNALKIDAGFSVGYMGVTGSASGSYSTTSEFTENNQYAFSNYTISGFVASFTDFSQINASMVTAAQALPKFDDGSGNAPSPQTTQAYKSFFQQYGTHTITSMSYGWRYQQQVVMSNSNSTDVTNFKANVEIAYMGNSAYIGAETAAEVAQFERNSTATTVAIGGAANLRTGAQNDPTNQQAKNAYENSMGVNDDAGTTGVGIETLGWLLSKEQHQDIGDQLDKALFYLLAMTMRSCSLQSEIDPYYGCSTIIWTLTTPGCRFLLSDGSSATEWKDTPTLKGPGVYIFHPLPVIECPMVNSITLNMKSSGVIPDGMIVCGGERSLVVEAVGPEPQFTYDIVFENYMVGTSFDFNEDIPIPVNILQDAPWLVR